jgi:hypothetical protein
MDEQSMRVPAACSADELTAPGAVEPVEAEGSPGSASLAFDRRSWLDLG